MNEDWRQLEERIETLLAEWSDDLDIQPPSATVTRLRGTIRHALNEEWLAGQVDATPSKEALEAVHRAVHQELQPSRRGRGAGWHRPWRMAVAGLTAAAAVIAGAVLLHQRTASTASTAVPASDGGTMDVAVNPGPAPTSNGLRPESGTDTAVDLFVMVAERVWTEHPLTAELRSDMDALEESLAGLDSRPNTVEEMIEDIGRELDDLLNEPVWQQQTSGLMMPSKGMIG